MTQDSIKTLIGEDYLTNYDKNATKLPDLITAIDSLMNKYGNPYLDLKKGKGAASYSLAGLKMGNVPKNYHHQQKINRYETAGYEGGQDWRVETTMAPDTIEMFITNLFPDFLAEMGHAVQYRNSKLPYNKLNSAFVRDSIKSEARLQKEKYGDFIDNDNKGTYGVKHQYAGGPPTMEYESHSINEGLLLNELLSLLKQKQTKKKEGSMEDILNLLEKNKSKNFTTGTSSVSSTGKAY